MSARDADQKAEMLELDLWGSGRNPSEHRMMSASKTANPTDKKPATGGATMAMPEHHHFSRSQICETAFT